MSLNPGTSKPDSVLPVLYDLAQTIGSELSVKTLLPRVLQRFLYHTSFPAGFICLAPKLGSQDTTADVNVSITAAIGGFRFLKAVNSIQLLSRELFISADIREDAGVFLDSLPGKNGQYTCFLRLKIPDYGFIFLIGNKLPENNLPLTRMFDPVLSHLGRAILLCSANDAQKNSLISERDKLADKQRLSAKMLDSINSGIFVTNAKGIIISVNGAFQKLTKRTSSFIIGKKPMIFIPLMNDRLVYKSFLKKLFDNDNWVGEVNIINSDNEKFSVLLMVSAIRDNKGVITNYMGFFTDISEKKAAYERLDFLSHYDSLTKLPNLTYFKEKVETNIQFAVHESSYLFLLSVNIDNFNTINNSLGRDIGDKLLIDVAERLLENLRETDVVSRTSADNFLIMLSGIREKEYIESIAQKLLSALSQPFTIMDDTINITSTMGISLFPDNGDDFDTLYKHADTALKYAKTSERSYYKFFSSSMDKIMMERFSIENQLRTALEHNEFTLYYQPFVDFRTNRVCGVEALLRWDNPRLGRVSPGDFIPVAEQTGLIVPIGEWVLTEACRQCSAWKMDGVPIESVAVNISAVQFKKSKLPEIVLKHLQLYNLNPKNLELELTESIMIHNTEHSLKIVAELKEIGVDLSLDDFGTGYSSFSYLSRFPIDKLKVDQSFIRDISINAGAAKIIRAIIDLGNNLELKTIAEGIETREQHELLKKLGCGLAQGYLHSRPLPADELTKKIDSDGYLIIAN